MDYNMKKMNQQPCSLFVNNFHQQFRHSAVLPANVLVQFCEGASGTVGESTVCEVASATISTQRGLWKSQHSQRFFFQPHGNPDLPQDRFSICMDG